MYSMVRALIIIDRLLGRLTDEGCVRETPRRVEAPEGRRIVVDSMNAKDPSGWEVFPATGREILIYTYIYIYTYVQ